MQCFEGGGRYFTLKSSHRHLIRFSDYIMVPLTFRTVQAPVAFILAGDDGEAYIVRMISKRYFTDTADVQLHWRVLVDGSPLSLPSSSISADANGWVPVEHVAVQPQACTARDSAFFSR